MVAISLSFRLPCQQDLKSSVQTRNLHEAASEVKSAHRIPDRQRDDVKSDELERAFAFNKFFLASVYV
jgi:hypothetical protein